MSGLRPLVGEAVSDHGSPLRGGLPPELPAELGDVLKDADKNLHLQSEGIKRLSSLEFYLDSFDSMVVFLACLSDSVSCPLFSVLGHSGVGYT